MPIINNFEKVLSESEKYQGNQSELSRACNVTRATISNIVNGQNYPSLLLALKLAYYLDVPLEKIFRYEPSKKDK